MGSQTADSLHAWLSRHLPDSAPKPALRRPINYIKIATVMTVLAGVITAITVASPYLLPIVNNRQLWTYTSVMAVLVFTSGQMFNHIRNPPYVSADGKGGIAYFAPGFQNQFSLETQIVAAMSFKVPRMADPKSQQVAVFVWGAIMYGMYSFLLSIFRAKSGGYPFWLPPF
ncbi:MAG: tumor suppressor candidate 3 [Chrysothrix sp. TS-e1954]|nr:MAG: tumor suppressor candidate 3 [Chrysothrix sp. TS-e1954]